MTEGLANNIISLVQDMATVSPSFISLKMSHLVGKPTMWFPNRADTNQAVQLQKQAGSLKFQI